MVRLGRAKRVNGRWRGDRLQPWGAPLRSKKLLMLQWETWLALYSLRRLLNFIYLKKKRHKELWGFLLLKKIPQAMECLPLFFPLFLKRWVSGCAAGSPALLLNERAGFEPAQAWSTQPRQKRVRKKQIRKGQLERRTPPSHSWGLLLIPHAPHGKAEWLSFPNMNPPVGDSSHLMLQYILCGAHYTTLGVSAVEINRRRNNLQSRLL